MPTTIVPIVEGHGEVAAVPLLLRRIAGETLQTKIDVKKPIRIPKQKLQKSGELERALDLAIQKSEDACGILILLDADDSCPKELASSLLERAKEARPDCTIRVVVAKAEYEAWFLGALTSLLSEGQTLTAPFNVTQSENIRGAKERLAELLDIFYSETVDQPAFTSNFDLAQAKAHCPSFDKLCRSLEELLAAA